MSTQVVVSCQVVIPVWTAVPQLSPSTDT
jgi:hypothetical protein